MRILLSNDDGYFAPGIAALAEALAGLGESRTDGLKAFSAVLTAPTIQSELSNRFQITGPVGADGARLPIGPVRFKNGGGAPITFTVATSNNPMEDARDLAETGLTGTVTISGVSDVEGAAAEGAAPAAEQTATA